jgi:YebC/PmpR family DNA-binding regulatory protein
MSGHSKWAKIKHAKGKADQERGKVFSKLIREITTAARIAGGDPVANPRLRSAIESARAVNMPMDNIDRAIKKGTGELPGITYEEIEYEGYGTSGVALIVKALTDNKNRTTSEIRHIFDRFGGNLGAAGSVIWQFQPKGVIIVQKERYDEDTVLTAALEAGAEDVKSDSTTYQIITRPEDFPAVKKQLEEKKIEFNHAELTRLPQTTVPLGERDAEKLLKLIEALEEHEDVQNVYANFDIPDEILEKVSGSLA